MKRLFSIFFVINLLFLISCDSDDDPVTPPDEPAAFNAKAGPNQESEVNQTVTLDGTESTGPSGFTYSWSYEGDVPEGDINFQNKTSALCAYLRV